MSKRPAEFVESAEKYLNSKKRARYSSPDKSTRATQKAPAKPSGEKRSKMAPEDLKTSRKPASKHSETNSSSASSATMGLTSKRKSMPA
jgi:hypothetical protein